MQPYRSTVGLAATTLLASSATLVCCVLPAVLVSIGAGATLVGIVSMFPQLIWLSEQKELVFGVAGALLVASGAALWRSRLMPCPVEPAAARSCARLRVLSRWFYGVAVAMFVLAVIFAFVLPSW